MKRSEKTASWIAHVETWQKSGMKQSEYCRANNLSLKAFSNWKLKQGKCSRERHADIPVSTSSPTPIPLIPVSIFNQMDSVPDSYEKAQLSSSSSFSGITLIVKNYHAITLAVDFNPATLRNLLSVLTE